jgi:microcystin degradation protein MlrC
MKKRVLIAGLFHETHSFVEGKTGLAEFQIRRKDELRQVRGDASPLDGVLEVGEAAGWTMVPAIDMRASPGGIVADEAVEFFWQALAEVAEPALRAGLDGIFLILHGAMVSESLEDVEGEILHRLRALSRDRSPPVFGVYDLHANFSEAMARNSNCLVAYRENPHTDARAAAVDAARLLDRCLETGHVPESWFLRVPIIWIPGATGTESEPMTTLERMARGFEAGRDDVWAVNVNAGFSFADTAATGVSFSLGGTCGEATAMKILNTLAQAAWERRAEGGGAEAPVGEVLDRICPVADGPVVLVESSDNIGGGASGDGTGLLRALISRKVTGAVVVVNDPAAARAAAKVGLGGRLVLAVGGRGSRLDAGPVELEVEVVNGTTGRFQLEDPQSHLASMQGRVIEMGLCSVVRHQGILILLTSQRTPPFDLGQLRSQGIEPERMKIIGVKAAVAHRRAYDPIAREMYWVATPGPCSSNLQDFPFARLTRPVYPLDPDATFPL